MYNNPILALRKLHSLIAGSKKSALTEIELLQKYRIEHAILGILNKATIDEAPLFCTGCHGESGIAIRITAPGNIKYALIYTGPEQEIASGEYNLTIYSYEPKSQLTCEEIYHRKFDQAPDEGWLKAKESNISVTNSLLASASQHAS